MSKVDWSKAPEEAEFYARGFRKIVAGCKRPYVWTSAFWGDGGYTLDECMKFSDYELRPTEWPDEARIDVIASNGPTGEHYEQPTNKYARQIIGLDGAKTAVDVYRVLDAFKTESAAIDHAVKKLLAPGMRHSKDREQDLREAIKSIEAELTLMAQR